MPVYLRNGELLRLERINPSSSAKTWVIPQKLQAIKIRVQNQMNRSLSQKCQSVMDTRPRAPLKEHPDFITPATITIVQKALVGKPLKEVFRSAPVTQEMVLASLSTKVI